MKQKQNNDFLNVMFRGTPCKYKTILKRKIFLQRRRHFYKSCNAPTISTIPPIFQLVEVPGVACGGKKCWKKDFEFL